jgi:hypothetical protein|tara:strand:+ start:1619 stop:1804 length:186 start_codon:yes stop_codon:yes gene_type:complete
VIDNLFLLANVAGAVKGEQLMATKTQLIHTAYFWLKNPDSTADRDQLIAGVQPLVVYLINI